MCSSLINIANVAFNNEKLIANMCPQDYFKSIKKTPSNTLKLFRLGIID